MAVLNNNLSRLVSELSKLPGIGEKSAERLAFHIFRMPDTERNNLAQGILSIRNVRHCPNCFNLMVQNNHGASPQAVPLIGASPQAGESDNGICGICKDNRRDRSAVCVVETYDDLWGIEKSAVYNGLYHVLMGRLAPLENIGPDQLTIAKLLARINSNSDIKEVILATNPTLEGDNTALYLVGQIQSQLPPTRRVKITRLARGIPSGSTIGYANTVTLTDSLKERQEYPSAVRT